LLLGRTVMFLFMLAKITPFTRSTAPLDYGW
jgi:hypothetical protein